MKAVDRNVSVSCFDIFCLAKQPNAVHCRLILHQTRHTAIVKAPLDE